MFPSLHLVASQNGELRRAARPLLAHPHLVRSLFAAACLLALLVVAPLDHLHADDASNDPVALSKSGIRAGDFLAMLTSSKMGSPDEDSTTAPREFLDPEPSTRALAIAVVIDNGPAMIDELTSLRENLPAVLFESTITGRERDEAMKLKVSICYCSNGRYEVSEFFDHSDDLKWALDEIKVDTPPNCGLAQGVKAATEHLSRDALDASEKWIMLIGNEAPEMAAADPAQLNRAIDGLIASTNKSGIHVRSLLCQRHSQVTFASYRAAREFMARMAAGTDGGLVNLASGNSRKYWFGDKDGEDALKTHADLINVVVDETPPAAEISRDLRMQLQQIAGVRSESHLTADYELRISYRSLRGIVEVELAIEKQTARLAEGNVRLVAPTDTELRSAVSQCLRGLFSQLLTAESEHTDHATLISSVQRFLESKKQMRVYLANDPRAQEALMRAIQYLYEGRFQDTESFRESIEAGLTHLVDAKKYDPDNPMVEFLMAEAYRQLAEYHRQSGNSTEAKKQDFFYSVLLGRAFQASQSLPDNSAVKMEIEAFYRLSLHDFRAAVELFDQLTTHPWHDYAGIGLRAHWFLLSISSGEWDVAELKPEWMNNERRLHHMQAILKKWPDSAYARHLADEAVAHGYDYKDFPLPVSHGTRFAMLSLLDR